jgi:hypothetical protein
VSLTIGLALALVVATGITLRADSGVFYCGYGACSLTYSCEGPSSWNYADTGGGNCEITLTMGSGATCSVITHCGESSGFWWDDPDITFFRTQGGLIIED